jgi:hypothetical protein
MPERFIAWRRQHEIKFRWSWALLFWIAMLAPSGLWGLALLSGFGLSSHACYPSAAPLAGILWPALPGALRIANVVTIALGLVTVAVGGWHWRRSKQASAVAREGEQDSRIRGAKSLGEAVFLIGLVVWLGLLANGIVIWIMSSCNLS